MITVRIMEESERCAVGTFVNWVMRVQYGCNAHALPGEVLLAEEGRVLVGAIGLSFSAGNPFPLERFYEFTREAMHALSLERKNAAQFGRWVAVAPYAADLLIHAAVRHAMRAGCAWGIGEAKPAVARRFARTGVPLARLSAGVAFSRVPHEVLRYYATPPHPSVYMFPLEAIHREPPP